MDQETSLKLTSEIVVAYLSRNTISRAEVAQLIAEVRGALERPGQTTDLTPIQSSAVQAENSSAPDQAKSAVREMAASARAQASAAPEQDRPVESRPAVPISESIHDDYLINLEDGKRYRSLRRHLMAKYGMSPADYRRKWGLPDDYPMVAPSYARERSEVAKKSGLGRTAATAAATAKTGRGRRSTR